MAKMDCRVIPAPKFCGVVADSALNKQHPWVQVMQERTRQFWLGTSRYSFNSNTDSNLWEEQIGDTNRYSTSTTKQKEESNFNFYCDACDRGFKENQQYKLHTDQHEACEVEGCNYVAAPKLVKLHYNMQHVTGFASKIKESSEDIAKWIEERRRNFPTAANIRRKQQEERERMERGEVLQSKQFGKMRGRGRGRGQRGNRGRHRQHQWNRRPTELYNQVPAMVCAQDSADPLSVLESHGLDRLPSFSSGTQSNSVTDASTTASTVNGNSTGTAKSGLSSLLTSYGDISSSEEEGEIRDTPKHDTICGKAKVSQGSSSSSVLPSPAADVRTRSTPPNSSLPRQSQKNIHRHRNNSSSTMKSQHLQNQRSMTQCNSSLLEKLLADEIRHERNVLLQCVRHVVEQNFFGVGSRQSESTNSGDCTGSYSDHEMWE